MLSIYYKEKNISDVLQMTLEEAFYFLININSIKLRLQTLIQCGLGYLTLGTSTNILSGGEKQRLKIAHELQMNLNKSGTLYIFDEPTTGLHFKDIELLIQVLDKLVKSGHTILAIEHNREFLKNCDYIIDIGPDAGYRGGKIVAQGTLEEIKSIGKGYTWKYL